MSDKDDSELYKFVSKSVEEIYKAARKTRSEIGPIEFSLAVTEIKEADGGIKVIVARAGGKYANSKITTIRFTIQPPKDAPQYFGTLSERANISLARALKDQKKT